MALHEHLMALPWLEILLAIVGVWILVFITQLLRTRDPEDAAVRTSRMVVGTGLGAVSVALTALATGVGLVATQLPELLITLLGLGAIASGFSPELFLGSALVLIIVMEALAPGLAR